MSFSNQTRCKQTKTKWFVLASMALGGGTVFGACTTRFKEAAVDGVTNFFLSPERVGDIIGVLGFDDLGQADPADQ